MTVIGDLIYCAVPQSYGLRCLLAWLGVSSSAPCHPPPVAGHLLLGWGGKLLERFTTELRSLSGCVPWYTRGGGK